MMNNNLRSLMSHPHPRFFYSTTAHCTAEAVASQLATARQNCETGSHQQAALAFPTWDVPR